MKRSKLLSLSAFLLILSAAIACDEGSNDSLFQEGDLQMPEISLFSFEDGMGLMQDATLDREMGFGRGFMDGETRRGSGGHFPSLQLSRDQLVAIMNVMRGSFDCIRGPLEEFRVINEALAAANFQWSPAAGYRCGADRFRCRATTRTTSQPDAQ